ncbi:hypothetical protein BJ508DRAFT_336526 [Ascobolus immersus RN42]|uniref:Mid2 domain-containing protein n=1 Tax=Ascobolus immersus RN42 TaxID=1160509 RepID=A0A3N4HCF2_ASCIM|nr:hypothetical protein BJ508DRAFT_336526 [Ascobolus immersus RN42]
MGCMLVLVAMRKGALFQVEEASPKREKTSKGLGAGGIAGVAIGAVAVLLVLGLVLAFLINRRRKKARYQFELEGGAMPSASQHPVVGELDGSSQEKELDAEQYNSSYQTGAPTAPTELPVKESERVELPTSVKR